MSTRAAVAWAGADPYAAALRTGRGPLFLRRTDGWLLPLEVERWCARADAVDRAVLDRCEGAVLDVGCGPGRLVAELAARGRTVLGIDVSAAAVDHTVRTGGQALRRSVFDPLPGEGRWGTVLLMDGNIGIGGDPRALLDRVARLLRPGGLLIAETAAVDVDERSEVQVVAGAGAGARAGAGDGGGTGDGGAEAGTVGGGAVGTAGDGPDGGTCSDAFGRGTSRGGPDGGTDSGAFGPGTNREGPDGRTDSGAFGPGTNREGPGGGTTGDGPHGGTRGDDPRPGTIDGGGAFLWARLGTPALLRYAGRAGWRAVGQWAAGGRRFVALRTLSPHSSAEPPKRTALISSQRARKPSVDRPVADR
ncbi:class I SAM-dependent methyltransferase [Streptomyces sp. Go40/10]|uniref:class I SAM-dependent methyltransferase n=1 Tax=Streptomyces sp. Go40/10 TaxID=2825844 RepID=UPI001E2DA09D|nr:class I SAM-dependent methyltransferase [Streptomyces sp. Go40/10]UFR00777.1 class I SAM-dependent methyltransferase [Streptomyces sp. Go40/10]